MLFRSVSQSRYPGVDLPNKKRMEYALTYIYGIGLHNSRLILDAVGIDYNKRAYELTGETASALVPESSRFLSYTATTGPADLKLFLGYTTLAGFMSSTPAYDFIQGNRYIILVPPSTVLASYYASLTGTATEKQLKNLVVNVQYVDMISVLTL